MGYPLIASRGAHCRGGRGGRGVHSLWGGALGLPLIASMSCSLIFPTTRSRSRISAVLVGSGGKFKVSERAAGAKSDPMRRSNSIIPASTVILPCPTPADAAARSDVEAATLTPNGSPPITRTTFPTCRAHYPGGSSGCACRLLPRITRPSPNGRRVGIRIVTFEACSGFTRVTARRIAQPPIGDLCHEAPTHAVTRTSRSSATGSIDNSPGGFFLH